MSVGRTLHTAEALLTMGPEGLVRDGAVVADDTGTILEVGPAAAIRSGYDARLDHALLMPGLVNCHVHMIDCRAATPVPGGEGLNAWVRRLLAGRRGGGEEAPGDLNAAIGATLATMRAGGTVAIGEVANSYATFEAIADSGMSCRFIHELIGFRGERADRILEEAGAAEAAARWSGTLRHTLGAHAPYSVSEQLMRGIAAETGRRGRNFHQHLAEDPAERELYERGSGPWREFLEEIGLWDAWEHPGMAPIAWYHRLGLLSDRFVAVHLADADDDEIRLVASCRVRAILSPTSNLHITGLLPRLATMAAAGLRFGLGTDGRGSNASVDVLDEARLLAEHWHDRPAGLLLRALTAEGAAILEYDDVLGSIRPGARPGLLAIRIDRSGEDLAGLERQVLGAARGHRTIFG